MNIKQATVYIYFVMIALSQFTIFMVNRLQNSRIGRAWIALRKDEVACQAMGIDKHKTKLMAFALGATWAGFAGVVFAAKTTFINPASFTLWESINILCVVVLGGMGSIVGVIVGAFVLILLPEYLRFLSEYRILAFGAVLVMMMMVFRPGGIVETVRRTYRRRYPDCSAEKWTDPADQRDQAQPGHGKGLGQDLPEYPPLPEHDGTGKCHDRLSLPHEGRYFRTSARIK